MVLNLRRVPATARYYTEPLAGLGEAIPLQMLLIPEGSFLMGSPVDEPRRAGNEIQRQVNVPFFLWLATQLPKHNGERWRRCLR